MMRKLLIALTLALLAGCANNPGKDAASAPSDSLSRMAEDQARREGYVQGYRDAQRRIQRGTLPSDLPDPQTLPLGRPSLGLPR